MLGLRRDAGLVGSCNERDLPKLHCDDTSEEEWAMPELPISIGRAFREALLFAGCSATDFIRVEVCFMLLS